jgi:adenylosuccinate synthase
MVHVVSPSEYQKELSKARQVQIEGAQGASLSIHSQFYPYCTSRDVSFTQMLADCAVPIRPMIEILVSGTARTFPIRVANRYDENGNMTQSSGPCYEDQEETSFEAIGQKVELTTVTKLPRRIFTYSRKQVNEAITYNGITEMFLNFCNYVDQFTLSTIVNSIEMDTFANVRWLGYGPTVSDIQDLLGEDND